MRLKFVIYLLLAMVVLNIFGYGWKKVEVHQVRQELTEEASYLVPYYICTMDGKVTATMRPEYLSLLGTHMVSDPDHTGDSGDTLLIWPDDDGTYAYGLILYDEGKAWQIEVDQDGNNHDPHYREVLNKHRDNIETLFARADTTWNLKDKEILEDE